MLGREGGPELLRSVVQSNLDASERDQRFVKIKHCDRPQLIFDSWRQVHHKCGTVGISIEKHRVALFQFDEIGLFMQFIEHCLIAL